MKHLLEFASERQREIIELFEAHGNRETVAKILGISRGTVSSALKRVKEKAAAAGIAPEHDMTKSVPDGFKVSGVSTLYDADGNVLTQWVKSKSDSASEKSSAFLEAVKEIVEPMRGSSRRIEPPAVAIDDQLSVYGWGDMHIGMLAWDKEAGEDFDLKICQELYERAVDRAVAVAPPSSHALVILVGDNFHANSSDWLTPQSKHRLDGDSRFQKVLRVGGRLVRYMLEKTLEKHEFVTAVITPGNHDPDSTSGLQLAMSLLYENNERLTIDETPGRFHWYRFGKCFFGITHGDTTKPAKLPMVMATRRAKDWGETIFRKWYTGHLHTEILRDYGGVVVETLATMSPQDAYATEHGYDSARKTIVDVWHKVKGKVARYEIGVESL